ncbi:hypothetical protein LPH50_09850 [Xylella taiwanensis]|nr:cytochrome c-type biogenesis CcmF C-terminal domain-containing protein [Xylella taiwanensis]MCD8458646.1 hypothetical protein [Xylella taiwanensis]UFM93400.1 hypothetical protein LPH39_09865 [Xylella taiwanensis]UFN01985.1 hypothetical protein LPH43_09930 [Xylella taiwanensis]UFN06452.1 hypothetical protein LPH42_09730 [Xylella taiwanensis]UFN08746.1 hypothetical protein LPH45_09740 [Xylella taiwanensis]
MPWLVSVALMHSPAITATRGSFTHWTLLLASTTFALALLGTCAHIGVLTSVHSFTTDLVRGAFILVFMVTLLGGALLLYAQCAPQLAPITIDVQQRFTAVSRKMLLLVNNLLLKTRWQREQPSKPLALLTPWAALALAAAGLAGIAAPLENHAQRGRNGMGTAEDTALHLVALAHYPITPQRQYAGHGLGTIGIFTGALLVATRRLQREVALTLGHITLRFDALFEYQGLHSLVDRTPLSLQRDGRPPRTLTTEQRRDAGSGPVMTEAGLRAQRCLRCSGSITRRWSMGNSGTLQTVRPLDLAGRSTNALGGLIAAADRRFRHHPESSHV